MEYGALAVIPNASRYQQAYPTTRVVIEKPNVNKVLLETTPLITRRRITQRAARDEILNWKILCLLMILISGMFIGIHLLVIEYNDWPVNFPFHLVDRDYWYHGTPITNCNLTILNSSLVSNVVLFHTRGDFCNNFTHCIDVISSMQKQNISEVPFNFLIGGDGKTYELRGWNYRSGFDRLPFNDESITVGLMGDFTHVEPVKNQVREFYALISEAIRRRKLLPNYKIHGARLHETDGHKMFKIFKEFREWVGWI